MLGVLRSAFSQIKGVNGSDSYRIHAIPEFESYKEIGFGLGFGSDSILSYLVGVKI